MNRNKSFWRKVVYIALMAILLLPLSYVSRPATSKSNGGVLARLRADHRLSQAQLGDIDPAGEAIKLAMFGMHGIAANILWTKANHYKMTEDWTKYSATLDQITKLQPNFIEVWKHQAWNLSYNVSVEFDNYLHRYEWVKRGTQFLVGGTRYNVNEPRLLWDIGWFFGQKFGRSDEHVQFRREFRKDTDFHDFLTEHISVEESYDWDGRPDNWLVGRQWFLKAQHAVDNLGSPLRGKSPVVFNSNPPMALINYAAAIEEDGYLGEKALFAWEEAHADWLKFGDREILTSYGFYIRLNEAEELEAQVEELDQKIDDLSPGLRETIKGELVAALPPAEREAVETPLMNRTEDQRQLAGRADQKVTVTDAMLAGRLEGNDQKKARKLLKELNEKRNRMRIVKRYRGIVNFDYWRTRCEVEQQEITLQARRFLRDADGHAELAELTDARDDYVESFALWGEVYDRYPSLTDSVDAEDIVDAVKRYAHILEQLDESFPSAEDFPLKSVVEEQDRRWRPWNEAPTQPEETEASNTPAEDEPSAAAIESDEANDTPPEETE